MGCGSSTQQTKIPKSKKDDKILGNEVPEYYVGEETNQQKTLHDDDDENQKTEKNIASVVMDKKEQKKRVVKKGGVKKVRGDYDSNEAIAEKINKLNKVKSKQDQDLILNSLKNHYVFYALTDEELGFVTQKMFYCENTAEYVFKQEDKASSYFIIESGQVDIIINDEVKRTLNPGESFGELALLYNAPRSASIRCKGNCHFWAIDRNSFRKTIEDMVQKNYESNRTFMEQVNFFKSMNSEQKDSIASALINIKFMKGDNIVNEGDAADSFFMIKEGIVSVWKDKKEIRKLGKGDSFGEQALYVSSKRAASVRAEGPVKLLSLGRDNLTKILGDKIQVIIFNNIIRWSFAKSDLLKQLTKIQVEKITNNCKIANLKQGFHLYSKDEACDKLIIVLEGTVCTSSGKEIATKGQMYGDEFLVSSKQNQQFAEDIIMKTDGVISSISYKTFQKCIGGDIEKVIKANEDSHEKKMANLEDKKDYSHIKLDHLIFIKKLGFGQFGSVYLVRNKDTGALYALKSVSKAQIIEQNLEKHLLQEKQVLETVNFTFVMQFIRTFKDNQSVYFLVEFISGMELFDVIRDIGLLSTQDSQFYIGTLILCMEYLHSRNIIYRDIKPENIMVDSKGYMYMIDMGTAKILKQEKHPGRTFTIIGTPHYMAPEIIQGKGYSYNADLWSVGICLYEFLCGGVPYAEEAEDPYEIYEEIIKKNNVKYPSFLKDKKAKRLIDQLLSKVPELRLGGSFAALKAHPWFDNFSWDELYNKTMKPPFIPPENKIIHDKEIMDMAKQGRLVINEIKHEQEKGKEYNKERARDPNWDKDF
ncbi:hypothetical protein ABPG72_017267 [Tetrahymena utriculariae]